MKPKRSRPRFLRQIRLSKGDIRESRGSDGRVAQRLEKAQVFAVDVSRLSSAEPIDFDRPDTESWNSESSALSRSQYIPSDKVETDLPGRREAEGPDRMLRRPSLLRPPIAAAGLPTSVGARRIAPRRSDFHLPTDQHYLPRHPEMKEHRRDVTPRTPSTGVSTRSNVILELVQGKWADLQLAQDLVEGPHDEGAIAECGLSSSPTNRRGIRGTVPCRSGRGGTPP